jgi:hypothetical protein
MGNNSEVLQKMRGRVDGARCLGAKRSQPRLVVKGETLGVGRLQRQLFPTDGELGVEGAAWEQKWYDGQSTWLASRDFGASSR